MANIRCDDVYFYSTDNPNGLNALWDDLNKAILKCYNKVVTEVANKI